VTRIHCLRAALVLVALATPFAEHGALVHARSSIARCPGGGEGCGALADWDLDASGLSLAGLEREAAGARWSAGTVHVGVDRRGLAIAVDGVGRSELPRAAVEPGAPSASPSAATARAPRVELAGVPAVVRVRGRIALPLPRGATVTISDPVVAIDGDGTPRAAATAVVSLPGGHALALADAVVEPAAAGAWRVAASATLDGGPPVSIAGEVAPGGARLSARAGGDAALELAFERAAATSVSVRARAWPLLTAGPTIAGRLARRGVGIDDAIVDGDVALSLGDDVSARASGLVVGGLRLDDRRLAPREVRLGRLAVDGTLSRTPAGWQADAALSHGAARVHAAVELADARVRVRARLATVECQALFDAMPDGMADALTGARLSGSISGSADVEVDLDRLATVDLERDAPPGTLALDFPVLESCRTLDDPPGIDLDGLPGPYRHVFVAGGRRHDRVLARGAPGFVPLARAPRIAAAFVALEDMRFRSHDGFDREQIERAFWHNLVAGGVRRGASTISQQTARNLWLGVDRSLARKLQEAWLTARLEDSVDKDRILELYMNLIELGPGVFGVDAAARHHFGVPAEDLDALQAIHLAALAPAPRSLSRRFANGRVDDAWLAELRDHARRMHRNGMLSAGDLATALHSDLRLVVHASPTADAAP
jgi:hypothetical protein